MLCLLGLVHHHSSKKGVRVGDIQRFRQPTDERRTCRLYSIFAEIDIQRMFRLHYSDYGGKILLVIFKYSAFAAESTDALMCV